MKYLAAVSAGILLTVTQGVAWAQIYESRDDQGNPVFSDEPVDGSSSAVDLPETNIADAPAPGPEQQDAPGPTGEKPVAKRATDGTGQLDPNAAAWEERQRRQEAFDRAKSSSTPTEVLDGEPPREVLDAEPPREVLDAEPRREVGDF